MLQSKVSKERDKLEQLEKGVGKGVRDVGFQSRKFGLVIKPVGV